MQNSYFLEFIKHYKTNKRLIFNRRGQNHVARVLAKVLHSDVRKPCEKVLKIYYCTTADVADPCGKKSELNCLKETHQDEHQAFYNVPAATYNKVGSCNNKYYKQ